MLIDGQPVAIHHVATGILEGQVIKPRGLDVGGILLGALWSFPALSQEVTQYQYDSLGRMVRTDVSGGSNNGVVVGACFDAAGNRLQYSTGTSDAPACVMAAAAARAASSATRERGAAPSRPEAMRAALPASGTK